MNSSSSDFTFSVDNSQLLVDSSLLDSSSHTGPGGNDLSISELSLSDRTVILDKPFSLLATAHPRSIPTPPNTDEAANDTIVDIQNDGSIDDNSPTGSTTRQSTKLREEKLQSDIFILKKLNASFSMFYEALMEAGSANERIASQLEQTDALLNKYVDMLHKTEEVARLIFDENWEGTVADEEILERERIEKEDRLRKEAEERNVAAQRERERRELEEHQRLEQEARERREQERQQVSGTRGIRIVRGNRASMRVTRGSTTARLNSSEPESSRLSSGSSVTRTRGIQPTRRSTTSGGSRRSTMGLSRGVARRG